MKKIIFLLLLVITALPGFSQKTIAEWSQLDEKKFTKGMQFDSKLYNLKRYIKSSDQLPPMKKVGIMCYYFFTPSPTMRSINLLQAATIKDEGSAFMVDKLFDKAYPGLKDGFDKKDITLLGIDEYLDTDDKKNLYESTEFTASQLTKGAEAYANYMSGRATSGDVKTTPQGYKLIMESAMDIKLQRTIGDFAKKVGVDAVVDIKQTIWWDGKNLALGPITMDIIGPNPVPENKDDWYAPVGPLKGYVEGWLFGNVTVDPPKPYSIGTTSKKSIELNIEDLDAVYSRIAQSLVDYVNGQIKKLL